MPPTTTTRPAAAPDRELTHPLDRLKGVIRRFVAYDTVLFVALFLSLWFWVGLGIDYGLFKLTGVDIAQQLTPSLRMGITITLAVTLVALVVWRVTVLVNKRFDLGSLALILEKRHPKLLGDRLITAIQMYDVEEASKQGYSADLVRNTIGEARERMKQVNVRGVFNWGRLWLKGGLIAGVWVLGVATALVLYAGLGGGSDLARGVKKTIDVSAIFLERNALFVPTPWPRRAHLEVIDFDDEGHPNEIRVGKGMPTPPKVTARAVKWVVADDPRWNPDGWRAMTIADLGSFGIAASKPVGFEGDFNNLRVDDLERAYPPAEGDPTFTALAAAADDLNNSRKLRMLEVPAVLKMRVDGVQTRSRNLLDLLPDAAGQYAAEVPNLTETVRFTLAAEDFITTRRQITLVPPPTLVDLSRDEFQPAYLHYAAPIPEMGGPADTLFTLRGRMVRLAPKKIGLSSDKAVFAVPVGTELHITAEADKDLKLVELRAIGPNPLVVPEFLRAEAKKETRDDRGVIVAEEFADMPIIRPVGANEARLELDRGSATGLRVGEVEFGAEKLGVRRFTLKFEGKRAIRQLDKPTEFQIDMTDSDGVKSTRTIAITAADDAPPQVEVLIDPVVRRVAGAYMVTPVARVPFLADSKVWDTEGLSAVRFEFRKTAEESPSVVALRAIAAAAVTANTFAPISSWALPATVVHSQTQFDLFFGGTIPAQADPNGLARLPGVMVDRFGADTAAIQRLTATQLDEVTVPRDGGEWADQLVRAELARQQVKVDGMKPADLAAARATVLAAWKARPAPELKPDRGPPAVKAIKLSDARGDAFDLQRFMPELLMKATDSVQQRYKVDLFVTAKDVNVELTGKDGKPTDPRSARNLDPIRLMVVSEQDLLVEIGKDEETQGQRMEDAVGLATATKSKLDVEFNLLRSLPPPNTKERTDQLASTQVRVTGFGQELGKVRELLTGMRTEYEKLYREMDVNRVSAPSLYKYRNEADKAEDNKTGYLDLLAQLLDDNRAMAKLEKSLEAVRGTLAAQQAPADGAMAQTTADYLVFLRLLNKLRDQIGTGNDKNKLLADLKRITDVQRNEIRTGIKAALDDAINRVRRPDVVLPRDITRVAAGKSAKIKIGVRWKLYPEKSIFLGLEVPKATELKFNPEDGVSVKDDGNDVTVVEVEVTAGAKAGVHTVTLRPGTFKPVELQIEVTK